MFTFKTIPLLAQATALYANISKDDYESYATSSLLNLLDGGTFWLTAYNSKINEVGISGYDDMESYTDSVLLNLLNGRAFDWSGSYLSTQNPIGQYSVDTFESYTDLATLNGLNGGTAGRDGDLIPWAGVYNAN